MFHVDKNSLPRYWYAYTGTVCEKLGECDGIVSDTSSEFLDYEEAFRFAYHLKLRRLANDLRNLKARHSGLALQIYAIRALWNSRIREGLAKHKQRIAEAQAALAKAVRDANSAVEIEALPNQIPVLGQRLTVGQPIYVIDLEKLTLASTTVATERIAYYSMCSEGTEAHYTLSDNRYVDSTLKSNYTGLRFYLDKDEAVEVLRGLVYANLTRLQERLKAL